MGSKLKHLEIIQSVVNRLASNSFSMKGLSVALVAAVLIFMGRGGSLQFAYVAGIPIVMFWGLDGYFLWQERLFRSLYDHVRKLDDADIDFSMNVSRFGIDYQRSWLGAVFSRTLIPFYGALVLMVIMTVAFG